MKLLKEIKNKIGFLRLLVKRRRFYPLLKIDILRYILCWVRKFYYINIRKKLKIWDGSQENMITLKSNGNSTIEYNLQGLHDVSCARSLRIIKPLSVIELFKPLSEMPIRGGELNDLDYPCEAKILTIGPRTEGEIFCLAAYGFQLKNIRGLDLISYSPHIDVGDMHIMPYADNSFDIVICSCVLVYSKMPKEACREIMRVCKNDGLICIAQDTVPNAGEDHLESTGKRTIFCKDYLEFFNPYVKRVFFQHELPERLAQVQTNQGSNYTMSLIFQLQKESEDYASYLEKPCLA